MLNLFSHVAIAAKFDAQQMSQLAKESKNGLIKVTDDNFNQIVEGPRDYTLVLLLTADSPQYQCGFCTIVSPAYHTVSNSWYADHPSGDGVFFAIADVVNAVQLFAKLGLKHAPNLYIYEPTETASPANVKFEPYQFPSITDGQAEALIAYLRQKVGINITVHEPVRWDRIIFSGATALFALFTVYMFGGLIWKFVQKKPLWVGISMLTTIMFTAGHMFNVIRRVPYIVNDGNGGMSFFVGGHSNQIAVETQIIGSVYAILAFSVVSMIVRVPRIKDPQKQLLAVTVLSVVFVVGFSFIMSKFHVKNGAYPFSLLPL